MIEVIQIGTLILRDKHNGKPTQIKSLFAEKTKELKQAEKQLHNEANKMIAEKLKGGQHEHIFRG